MTPKPRTRSLASSAFGFGVPEIEAPDHGILALGEDLSLRQLRSGAVRLEHAREANALGVIAPVAKRRPRGPVKPSTSFCGVKRSGENHPAV